MAEAFNVQGSGSGLRANGEDAVNAPIIDPITAEDRAAMEAARLVSAPSPYQAANPIPPPGSVMPKAVLPPSEAPYHPSQTFDPRLLEAIDGWDDHGGHVPGAHGVLASVSSALEQVDTAYHLLQKDTGKTPDNRLAVLAASADKPYQKAYVALSTAMGNIQKGIEIHERELNKAFVDTGVSSLSAEMRALVRSKPMKERREFIFKAIAEDNDAVLGAVLGVDAAFTEVDPELHKLWRRQVAEKRNPSTVKRIQVMQKSMGVLQRAMGALVPEFERAMRGKFAHAAKVTAVSTDADSALAKLRGDRML